MAFSTVTPAEAGNDDMKKNPLVRDSVEVRNFTNSTKSSMLKVVSARLVYETTVSKQQSVPKSYLLDHQANHVCRLKGYKEDGCAFAFSRTHKSFTIIIFPKCPQDAFMCSQNKAPWPHSDLSPVGPIQGIFHLIL